MRRTFLFRLVILLAVSVSCGKNMDPDSGKTPRLRSITLEQSSLVLPEGGSATLTFSVKDPLFEFSELVLQTASGDAPQECCLQSFAPASTQGVYTAVIADANLHKSYELKLCLAIVQRNSATGGKSFTLSPEFSVSSLRQGPDTGLPVVCINTEDSVPITSKTEYVAASLSIQAEGGYPGLESVNCSVRGRGNTTWEWPKKPYLVKLEAKQPILGMKKHKRWILLANFMDRTMMRNLVSMKVASMTGLDWTPHCVPVELVLNGKHQGNYLMIEQVRVDKDRVPVAEMKPEDSSGEALTGGYLLECDFHYDNEIQWMDKHGRCVQMGSGVPFGIKYPDPEDITEAQIQYIKGYISEAAAALYGSNFKDPAAGYAKYIDVDSFVDYWLVFEVMCNHELGNPGSVYMHKDRGGKLVAGPCWDFDWGILSFFTSRGDKELVNRHAIWYERLFQDPEFASKVQQRFRQLLPQLNTIPAYMDECEALLSRSAKLNFSMWNPAEDMSMNNGNIINGDEYMDFHSAVQRLKDNYLKHLRVIDNKLAAN